MLVEKLMAGIAWSSASMALWVAGKAIINQFHWAFQSYATHADKVIAWGMN